MAFHLDLHSLPNNPFTGFSQKVFFPVFFDYSKSIFQEFSPNVAPNEPLKKQIAASFEFPSKIGKHRS